MVLVSATRIRIKPLAVPTFLLATFAIRARIARRAGYRGGRLLAAGGRWYWTLTLWDDEASVRAFRDGDRHGEAMRKTRRWATDSVAARWEQEGAGLPDWAEAARRLGVDAPRARRAVVPMPAA